MAAKKKTKDKGPLDDLLDFYAKSKKPDEVFHRDIMRLVSELVERWQARLGEISKLEEDQQADAFGTAGYSIAKASMLLLGLTIGSVDQETRARNLRLAVAIIIGALEDLAKGDLIPDRNEVIIGRTLTKQVMPEKVN